VGANVGRKVGSAVGRAVGRNVGFAVGRVVGSAVHKEKIFCVGEGDVRCRRRLIRGVGSAVSGKKQ